MDYALAAPDFFPRDGVRPVETEESVRFELDGEDMGKKSGALLVTMLMFGVADSPRDAAAQTQGSLGVRVHDAANGVAIDEVTPQSAAEKAGLRAGDVVVEFDGERVRSVQQFTRLVQETPPGRQVSAVIQRDGATQKIQLTPEQRRLWPPRPFTFDGNRLGTMLMPLNDQLAAYFGVKEGVLVSSVDEGSAAAKAGLQAGDVILAVNGRMVRNPADVRMALMTSAGSTLDLRIVREKRELTLTVRG